MNVESVLLKMPNGKIDNARSDDVIVENNTFVFIRQKKALIPLAYHLIIMHISLAYIKPRLISNGVNEVNGKWKLKIVEERNCVYIARFPIRD